MNCWYRDTTCCRIHDGSLADKIRYARYNGIKFHIPYEPKERQPAPQPVQASVVVPAQASVVVEDPLHQLLLEKAMIQSEMELLNLMKKKLEVRMLIFKMKASDYWEVGSAEMDF
jgi:hypothetical protein